MSDKNHILSAITLNINGLSMPIIRQGLAGCIFFNDLIICYLQATHFRFKSINRLKKKRDGQRYTMQKVTKRELKWLY